MSDYHYDAVVRKIHDGDTITVDLDFGLDEWRHGFVVRFFGINAPEINTPEGKVALAFLQTLIKIGDAVDVQTIKDEPDKYGGRYLGIIRIPNKPDTVNELMVKSGHAKVWDGKGPKPV